MGKITLKNISTATVNIVYDRFRSELVPGRVIAIKRDDYDNLMFDPGFNNLVKGHYIQIDGVSEEDAVTTLEKNVYDVAAIEKMLDTKDYTNFAKFMPNATMAERDTVVKLAVDKGITDSAFTALIKKYCNVDVVSAFDIKRKSEER